jgi:hypothetical protein
MNTIKLPSNTRATSNVGLLFTMCASSLLVQELPKNYDFSPKHSQVSSPLSNNAARINTVYIESSNANALINNCVYNLLNNSTDIDSELVDLVNENFWSLV